jgi:hypothetical protein
MLKSCFLRARACEGAAFVLPDCFPVVSPALASEGNAESLPLLRVLPFDFGDADKKLAISLLIGLQVFGGGYTDLAAMRFT